MYMYLYLYMQCICICMYTGSEILWTSIPASLEESFGSLDQAGFDYYRLLVNNTILYLVLVVIILSFV